jgi:hypothetical protein
MSEIGLDELVGFEQLVSEMAAAGGLKRAELPTVLIKGDRADAIARHSYRSGLVLYTGSRLLRATVEVQRRIVGRELAHVVLGDVYVSSPRNRLIRRRIAILAGPGLVLMLGGLLHDGLRSSLAFGFNRFTVGVLLSVAAMVVHVASLWVGEGDAERKARELFGVVYDKRLAEGSLGGEETLARSGMSQECDNTATVQRKSPGTPGMTPGGEGG